jgi:sugar phosphate isomerase/epimerase
MAQPICLQLYTVRDAMAADWKATLARVAQIGYAGVEAVYTDKIPAATFKAELDRHKLLVSGAHVGIDYLRGQLDQVIADLKLFGAKYIICPWMSPDQRGDAAKWRAFMHEFEVIGDKCRAAGMQFLYHHHDFELAPLGTTNALSILLDESKPGTIDAEIDIYWVAYAGLNPVEMINKYHGRVPCVHLKDMAAGSRTFAEVGHGTLDIAAVLKAADAAGTQWLIVEQDSCQRDPFESVTMSYEWLKRHGRA